jgi:hypothetical protein
MSKEKTSTPKIEEFFLKQTQRHHKLISHPIPSSKPYPNHDQMFSYPNKSFAGFIRHAKCTQIPQCHPPITLKPIYAPPPKLRPRHPRPSPSIASPPMTTHNNPKPIRVDLPRKNNVKNKMSDGENSHNFFNEKRKTQAVKNI